MRTATLTPALLLLTLAGCGKPAADGPAQGDEGLLQNLVSTVPDRAGNAKTFRESFAAGATAPADKDRARYQKLYFKVTSGPSIQGDTATARVQVRDDDSP